MALAAPLQMMGAPGSPYSRKMRSLLRYRRIPYVFIVQHSREAARLPAAKVPLLPTFYLPDEHGEIVSETDSTPLIRRFELAFEGRSVVPLDPALAFLDELIEDYADEWLTKCMFHYRWYHEADATKARRVLPHWAMTDVSDEQIAPIQKMIGDRQIGRLGVVGSNDVTAEVIEDSYLRFLSVFDRQLQKSRFLFGRRPASSDFGIMGQLTCLALFDPTPAALTAERAPRVYAWTEIMEDLSGMEPVEDDWARATELPDSFRELLCEVGRFHAPFLLANADALARGSERVETEIDGRPWVQKPFPYQGKCLAWLRESYAKLEPQARTTADGLLEGTGCEVLFH
ncbi:MAG: glutathione S-transferase N-terminal domain-containing protein [Deltaproteobacteria bacterium]|jgi:glutathione S-transferase|nr:glutathione S-transferase N-terminal domain-containing protein [Deltaproteobacteria bacterium]MBW2498270.1 glutathione S-transferase N-terminal domain-containing protein [Deltaproteobacteria bacterium]